jgi:hypothetical protein
MRYHGIDPSLRPLPLAAIAGAVLYGKMAFLSISPTCQSVIYGFICRNDGDRLNWESFQSHQPKAVARELRRPA